MSRRQATPRPHPAGWDGLANAINMFKRVRNADCHPAKWILAGL
jgi:hypothetical protein